MSKFSVGHSAFQAAHNELIDKMIDEMANNAKQLEAVIAQKNQELLQKNQELLQKNTTIAELSDATVKLSETIKELHIENETLLNNVKLLQEKAATPLVPENTEKSVEVTYLDEAYKKHIDNLIQTLFDKIHNLEVNNLPDEVIDCLDRVGKLEKDVAELAQYKIKFEKIAQLLN